MKPYYEDTKAGITIYHGDCMKILPSIPKCDLLLTDPPYDEKTHQGARSCPKGDGQQAEHLIDFKSVSAEKISSVFSSVKLSGWCVATVDWRHVHHFENHPPNGMRFVRFGIWVKPNGAPQFTGDRPATGWEAVAILHKEGGKMKWNGGGHHAVFTHNIDQRGFHPTGKPESLFSELCGLFSNPGQTVLDPFMGSGTTLRAAKDLGRKTIGIELEERYCEIAAKRLAQEVLAI